MKVLNDLLHDIIDDESLADYIKEAIESSETVEEFQEIAIPIFLGLDNVVSSEEEAIELTKTLFKMKIEANQTTKPSLIYQGGSSSDDDEKEKIDLKTLISGENIGKFDPFYNERVAKVKKVLIDHDQGEEKRVQRMNISLDEDSLNEHCKRLIELTEAENAQFRPGTYFRRPETRSPHTLYLDPINVHIGSVTLIEGAKLKVSPGNRYGLVGRNGYGKTTLMKYISSSLIKGVDDDLLIIHVQQEAPISERTVLDSVLDVDIERTELLDQLHKFELAAKADAEEDSDDEDTKKDVVDKADIESEISSIQNKLDAIGASDAEARAATILISLGFTQEQLIQPLSLMSGGFRMRVALAQALYISPDVLLLDEPTGHLDAPSVCWLEEYLSRYCSTQILICVSHDRVFLDNVCTHIIHLKDMKLNVYKGNWSAFHDKFAKKCEELESKLEEQKRIVDHKMDYVRRLGVDARYARLAHSRMISIKRMEKITLIEPDPPVSFHFEMTTEAAQDTIISLEDVSFGYVPSKLIFEHLNFHVKKNSRIVVIGANGTGKSTFIKLLMGKLKPISGFYQMISNLRVAYFSQHHVDQLEYKITPLQYLLNYYKNDHQLVEIRALCEKFGLTGEQILQPIQNLSGGQKTRVVLAACAMMKPHVLVFDEVTNNLDMDSIEALGEAIQKYSGAIVAVTHDQAFATMIANQIFVCDGKTMNEFDGTFQEYRMKIKEQISQKFSAAAGNKGLI